MCSVVKYILPTRFWVLNPRPTVSDLTSIIISVVAFDDDLVINPLDLVDEDYVNQSIRSFNLIVITLLKKNNIVPRYTLSPCIVRNIITQICPLLVRY